MNEQSAMSDEAVAAGMTDAWYEATAEHDPHEQHERGDVNRRLRDGRDGLSERETREVPEESTLELARHGDPSERDAAKRSQLLEQVRDRRSLRWVPASELLRRMGSGVADLTLAGSDYTRLLRKEAMRGGMSERRRQLGPQHPIREAGREMSAVRGAPGLA